MNLARLTLSRFLRSWESEFDNTVCFRLVENSSRIRYYNARRVRLGVEFRDEAWESIQRIQKFPQAWHPLGGTIRRCQMQRFPYGIIYEPSESEILIIAIAHLHQEPEYWRSRVQ